MHTCIRRPRLCFKLSIPSSPDAESLSDSPTEKLSYLLFLMCGLAVKSMVLGLLLGKSSSLSMVKRFLVDILQPLDSDEENISVNCSFTIDFSLNSFHCT